MKLESAITYAVPKMCENSDQEDKDSNCPTMHKTILQHFLFLSHSIRILIIRWKCQTLHTICNQRNLFKMETHCVTDGTKLKCTHLNYRGAIVSHVHLEEVLWFLSEEKVEKIRCCSVLQKQMKRCNREPTFQCQNYMQSNMHVQSKQAHKKLSAGIMTLEQH